ncbi:MAG: hypothetical protein J2P30_11620 [Actinobacteria bacterium]|nr:hypothetical protein [Actinomycetota bacterium]
MSATAWPLRARSRSHGAEIIANAISLFGTTVITSAAGFAFWGVAAHLFSTRAIGSGSAAISALQLMGEIGMVGLGSLLIGELSKGGPDRRELLSTALAVATAAGAVVGLGFALLVSLTSPGSREVPGGAAGIAMFVAAVAITAALLVLDDATVGLSRAHWQLWRNATFSILKLAVLPVLALAARADGPAGLVGAWLAGAVLSVALVAGLARHAGARLLARPRWQLIRRYRGTALTHHWLNLSSAAPRLLLPVLVAAFLGPAVNAAFYIALLIAGFAYVVPAHLSTALFAVASGDRAALAHVLRRAVFISALTGAGSVVVFWAGGHLMLSLFGHNYEAASGVLAILGMATFASGVKALYMAICRVNGDLRRCAIVSGLGSAAEVLVPALALAEHRALPFVSFCFLVTVTVEALLLWPSVAVAGELGDLPRRAVALLEWTAPGVFKASPEPGRTGR